jgi:hypothetical protein
MRNQLPADELSSELENAESSVATLEPAVDAETSAPEWKGPRCEKCSSPIKSDIVTICRRCGWYASLGMFVEIDSKWETEGDDALPKASAPQKSHIQVWIELIPRWGWVIIASALVIVVESIVARVATPDGSALRTTWSLSQLAIGVIAAVVCHVFNFVVLAAEDADFGVMDVLLKPVKLWLRAFNRMPTRLWVANAAVCGTVAAAMSLLVIGGIPYERLWDWGIDAPVKQDLMGAVMDRAKKLDSRDQSLEEAIGDFAGKAGVEEGGEAFNITPEAPREKTDCVILGYQLDREGRLDTLVLGTAHGGKLVHAGRVKPEMSEEARSSLLTELMAIKTLQPFITVEANATWVKPKIACRVSYAEKIKSGQLRDIKWDSLLGSMRSR